MKEALVLPTERPGLVLRELATEADDLIYFNAVQEVREHVDNYGNSVASVYDSLEKVRNARLSPGLDVRMGIWDSGDFKGSISARTDDDVTEAQIGYWLKQSAVGNGYATLAVKALTPFVKPRFARVLAEVNIDNTPSLKVMERAGYIRRGLEFKRWGLAVIFEPGE